MLQLEKGLSGISLGDTFSSACPQAGYLPAVQGKRLQQAWSSIREAPIAFEIQAQNVERTTPDFAFFLASDLGQDFKFEPVCSLDLIELK